MNELLSACVWTNRDGPVLCVFTVCTLNTCTVWQSSACWGKSLSSIQYFLIFLWFLIRLHEFRLAVLALEGKHNMAVLQVENFWTPGAEDKF